jgi:hypothetical protein
MCDRALGVAHLHVFRQLMFAGGLDLVLELLAGLGVGVGVQVLTVRF